MYCWLKFTGTPTEGCTSPLPIITIPKEYLAYYTTDPNSYTPATEDLVIDLGAQLGNWNIAPPAAKIVETGNVYATVQAAIDAAGANQTVQILKDVTENITVASDDNLTLDLNGYVLKGTGSGSVITNNGTLEIKDSGSTAHYFKVGDNGLWTLDTTATSGTAWEDLTARPSSGDIIKVTGGCITGGSAQYGGGIYSNGPLTLSSGNIAGNICTDEGGGVYTNKVCSMTGGAVLGNIETATDGFGAGVYSNDDATFYISGGTAGYNTAVYWGGGIASMGPCVMSGGTIIGNKADCGGGIYVGLAEGSTLESSFTMTGGTIKGNEAPDTGGGISVNGICVVKLLGGTVTGNKAQYGGGVESGWTGNNPYILGGDIIITGNTAPDGVTANNLYLYPDYTISVADGTASYTYTDADGQTKNMPAPGSMSVGVTVDTPPTVTSPVPVTNSNGTNDYTAYFTSDNTDYVVLNGDSNAVWLHKHGWAYTASGATLTAACVGAACGKTASLTVSSSQTTYTYDGNPKPASLSDTTAWTGLGLTVPTITYTRTGDAPEETGIFYADTALDGGDGTTAPSAPGVYTASITAGGATASTSFTISKQAQPGAPVVTGTKPTSPYASDGKITGLTDEMEITNDNGATWVKVPTGSTEANNLPSGKYIVRYAATDTRSASPCTDVDLFVPAIAVSTDGGTTWTEYDDHTEGWKAAIAAGGTEATPVKVKLMYPWTATDGSFGTGGDDTGLNGYICVPSGKYIDLDLNGKTLDGANGTGVIVNKGTLAISNGTVTGGNATQGGGINNSGTLLLNGVSLTGNTATNGGGLYTSNSNVTVGGSTTITGNTGGNAYLPTGVTLQVGTGENVPSGMQIGVTTETAPAEGGFVNVTGTNASDYSGCFMSDDTSCVVVNGSGNVVQLHKHVWTYTASGATLTVTCTGVATCGKTASLTVSTSQTTYTYDGNPKPASLSDATVWTGLGLTVPTITYTRTGDAPEETGVFFADESLGDGDPLAAPSAPGEYTASISAGGATASVDFTITKEKQPDAPTGVKGTRPSRVGAEDGKITGLTSDMEVSDDNGATWHKVPAGVTEATGLPSGIYLVRYAATDTKAASACVSLNLLRTAETGDGTPIALLAALLSVSMAGILLIRRRKAGNK